MLLLWPQVSFKKQVLSGTQNKGALKIHRKMCMVKYNFRKTEIAPG